MSDANALSSDFRKLETQRDGSRACQLFRASASAFASLSRPTKTEIQQFQDLSLALYDRVPETAKRHAAVMIASNAFAPRELVLKLANEPAGICAPLLARSPIIQARDIPPLIARHGLEHARVLAQRAELEAPLRALLSVFIRQAEHAGGANAQGVAEADIPAAQTGSRPPLAGDTPLRGHTAETVRGALRGAMAANSGRPMLPATMPLAPRSPQSRLQPTALMDNPAFFITALADTLDLPFARVSALLEVEGKAGLIMALRSIPLLAEEAFVIASALWPGDFASRHSIARFLDRYRHTAIEAARDRVARWREDALAGSQAAPFAGHTREVARNDDVRPARLRAS
ncbi:MAG: hypothetical protein CMJ42_03830 [Phyllobacteriaceae bacterium]|nr:hypothetical protein [Phyllobacteriaceae bacterium]MBA92879.1 hypothetical protein [Phyllobacteriaceae bacterium]